jgi:putative transposase
MTHRKVFRFRMKPDAVQRETLARMAGGRRYVWNWALAQRQAHYRDKSLPASELSTRLTALKQQAETSWLQEADSQAMQQTLADLQRAYVNFFKKRACLPRFKSRKRDQARFRIPQRVKVADGRVYVPKVSSVGSRQSQLVKGDTKSATFKRDTTGNWDVTLVTNFTMPDTAPVAANPCRVVGIDLGLKDFAVLSNGERIRAPQFLPQGRTEVAPCAARVQPAARRAARVDCGRSTRSRWCIDIRRTSERISCTS